MNYFIWDHKEPLLGLSAETILNSRLDFRNDDVIVIHKEGERNNIVMMETKSSLRETYDIDSTNPDVVGFVVAIILAQENAETIREQLEEMDRQNENSDDLLQSYTDLLDSIMSKVDELNLDSEKDGKKDPIIPLSISYLEPEFNLIDLTDIEDDVEEKKLTVVLDHVFITGDSSIDELRCMSNFTSRMEELIKEREKYKTQGDFEAVEITNRKLDQLEAEVRDECDALVRIDVERIYQYNNVLILDCVNGQTMFIQREAIDTMRNSAVAYEKRRDNGEKYKVHYKIFDVSLNAYFNELIERGNTVYVIEV